MNRFQFMAIFFAIQLLHEPIHPIITAGFIITMTICFLIAIFRNDK